MDDQAPYQTANPLAPYGAVLVAAGFTLEAQEPSSPVLMAQCARTAAMRYEAMLYHNEQGEVMAFLSRLEPAPAWRLFGTVRLEKPEELVWLLERTRFELKPLAVDPTAPYRAVLEAAGFELEPRYDSQRLHYQAGHWPSLKASQFKVLLYAHGPQVLANLHHTVEPFIKVATPCFQGQQIHKPADLACLLQNATALQAACATAALPAAAPVPPQTSPGDALGTTSCLPASGLCKYSPGCATGAAGAE